MSVSSDGTVVTCGNGEQIGLLKDTFEEDNVSLGLCGDAKMKED
jgi:hypothetical protein